MTRILELIYINEKNKNEEQTGLLEVSMDQLIDYTNLHDHLNNMYIEYGQKLERNDIEITKPSFEKFKGFRESINDHDCSYLIVCPFLTFFVPNEAAFIKYADKLREEYLLDNEKHSLEYWNNVDISNFIVALNYLQQCHYKEQGVSLLVYELNFNNETVEAFSVGNDIETNATRTYSLSQKLNLSVEQIKKEISNEMEDGFFGLATEEHQLFDFEINYNKFIENKDKGLIHGQQYLELKYTLMLFDIILVASEFTVEHNEDGHLIRVLKGIIHKDEDNCFKILVEFNLDRNCFNLYLGEEESKKREEPSFKDRRVSPIPETFHYFVQDYNKYYFEENGNV